VRYLHNDLIRHIPPIPILKCAYTLYHIYTVSKNVPPVACYNFDTREQILISFGRNVIDKVGNQKMF